MKRVILAIAALVAAFQGFAAAEPDYSSYYKDTPVALRQVSAFPLPSTQTLITDYGAKGDGITLCTDAFARAIAELSARGGGRLVVPEGIWLTGPIEMLSGVELHLERNAMILFSPDKSLYLEDDPKARRVKACISATRARNIAITGLGTIDGNGAQWRPVKRGKVSDTEWSRFRRMGGELADDGKLWYPWKLKSGYPDIAATAKKQEGMRNDLFRIHHCENVLLRGVTFQNAPKFHVHPFNSVNVIIDGITVRCPWNAQNGDAIDISDCHRVLIVNSVVDCGDDGLCMKSGDRKKGTEINGCEDIMIQDCTVYRAHGGFVIGSEDICGMTRIVVRDCTFSGTDIGLRFKSAVGRGGVTKDIYISDIVMTDILDAAISFQCDYADRPAGRDGVNAGEAEKAPEKVPLFRDIHISDVVCRGADYGIVAAGIAGMDCVSDITVSNSVIAYTREASRIDEATARITLRDVKLVSAGRD